MALNPLQSPVDSMIGYLHDAQMIHQVTQERLGHLIEARRAQAGRGNGQPGVEQGLAQSPSWQVTSGIDGLRTVRLWQSL